MQNKLDNELFSCVQKFLYSNKDKLGIGESLRKAVYIHLEDIYVRHTKMEDMLERRIKFYIFLGSGYGNAGSEFSI